MVSLNHPVLEGITPGEYEEMLGCGCIRMAEYPKNSVIFHTGDSTREFGLVMAGEIHIENIDLWGNRMILHHISAGGAFGETYAFCGVPMMVDVTAVRDCQILLIHLGVLLLPCHREKSWAQKLVYNLLILSTNKNLLWSRRMFCITSKQIRTRVMTYLSWEGIKQGSREFSIPFDRQQMADYLNVERSALSKELGRMQKDGILTFRKNRFCLLRTEPADSLR